MFKTLSSKIIFMFILMSLAFIFSTATSYVAINTQEQHLILIDLLGQQKLYMERVVHNTLNLADIAVMSEEEFEDRKKRSMIKVDKSVSDVENMLESLKKNEIIIHGSKLSLKFDKEFSEIFYSALNKTLIRWSEAKELIDYLMDYENMKNKKLYMEKLQKFEDIDYDLLDKSEKLANICRTEAEANKDLSDKIEILSVLLSIFVFIVLLSMMLTDFYSPVKEIKKVFINMSHGKIDQRFSRDKDDEFKDLYDKFNEFIENLNTIFSFEDTIIAEDNIDSILEYIDQNFKKFIPFEEMGVVYKDADGKKIKRTVESSEEDISDIKIYFKIEKEDHRVIVPIQINSAYLGYMYFEFLDNKKIEESYINFLDLLKEKLSLAFYKNFLVKELLGIVTSSLSKMAESKDPETGRHLMRMSMYTQIVAKRLYEKGKYLDEINKEFIENIKITAPMHDIGKVSIPDNILLKPGKLDSDEFEIMKTHAAVGGVILENIDDKFRKYNINYFKMAADIAYGHQEKYDGSGYPKGLSGKEIPLSARITAIADVFDALSSKRPYKEAFSLNRCYDIIKNSRGSHFDPNIVDAFFESLEEIKSVYDKYKEI